MRIYGKITHIIQIRFLKSTAKGGSLIVASWRRITKKAKSLSLSQNATYHAKYQTKSMMKVSFSLSFTFISGVPLKPNSVTMHGQSRDDAWRRV